MKSWLHLAAYPAAYGILFGTMLARELTLHARPFLLYPVFGIVLMPTLYLFRWLRRGEGTIAEAIGALVLNSVGLIVFFTLAHWSGGLIGDDKPAFGEALYFSIVTWTTLGYGDVQPIAMLQLLAASEALVGYVYLGLLIVLIAKAVRI